MSELDDVGIDFGDLAQRVGGNVCVEIEDAEYDFAFVDAISNKSALRMGRAPIVAV